VFQHFFPCFAIRSTDVTASFFRVEVEYRTFEFGIQLEMFVNIATEGNLARGKCVITFTTEENLLLTFIMSKCDTMPFESKATYNIYFFQSFDHLISPTII